MGEFTKPLERLGERGSPSQDALDRIQERFTQRRRRRRVGGLVVGLATAAGLVIGGIVLGMIGGSSPTPGSSSSLGDRGDVYLDPAGWSLTVPRGWIVVPFRSSEGDVTAAGAQISNVPLPAPSVVGWAPIQADGRGFPRTGIAIVVGTQEGGRVRRSPASDLPITYPGGWIRGSAPPGAPYLDAIWFRGGGHLFVATVKTGARAAPADRRTLASIVRSIRFVRSPSPPAGRHPPVWARIVLPSTTMTAGSTMSGRVVVHNDAGRALHVSGCLSPFAVALGNDEIRPTIAWATCLQTFTIPVGRSSWPVTVAAHYLACNEGKGSVPCTGGQPPPLPSGDYRAMLFQRSHVVPTPPPVRVRVTS